MAGRREGGGVVGKERGKWQGKREGIGYVAPSVAAYVAKLGLHVFCGPSVMVTQG